MRKHLTFAAMAGLFCAFAGNAFAESPAPAAEGKPMMEHEGMGMGEHHPAKSLDEAKERAQKHLDRLNKMTPEEWEAQKKRRMEAKEHWKNMTPEEREKKKAEMKEHREKMKSAHDGAAAPAPEAAPSAGH